MVLSARVRPGVRQDPALRPPFGRNGIGPWFPRIRRNYRPEPDARPASRLSHRDLLAPLDIAAKAGAGHRPGAVVVPTSRPAAAPRSGLTFAARIAAQLQRPLVVLVSKDAATKASVERMRAQLTCPSGDSSDTLLAQISDAPTVKTRFAVDELAISRAYRRGGESGGVRVAVNDAGRKRNLATLLASSMGWSSVLLLDDDVFDDVDGVGRPHERHARTLDVRSVEAGVAALASGQCSVVGWTMRDFDDNSVLFRMRRALGQPQEQFVGAGALLVRTDASTPFFPAIYNDDWLFLLAQLRYAWPGAPWFEAGFLHQDPYEPYGPNRAASEELGDILGEGLLTLVPPGTSGVVPLGTREHWERALADRRVLRDELERQVMAGEHSDREDMLLALKAVGTIHERLQAESGFWLGQIETFLRTWTDDLAAWRCRLGRDEAPRPRAFLSGRDFAPGGVHVLHGGSVEDFVTMHAR